MEQLPDKFPEDIKKLKYARPRNFGPNKLTKKLQDKICAFIRGGNYIETSVRACGICKQTFYNWMKKANEKEPTKENEIYRKFLYAVEEALSQSEMADVTMITKAANAGIWQASAWRLERKFPDRWGMRGRMELNHSGNIGVQIIDDIPDGEEETI